MSAGGPAPHLAAPLCTQCLSPACRAQLSLRGPKPSLKGQRDPGVCSAHSRLPYRCRGNTLCTRILSSPCGALGAQSTGLVGSLNSFFTFLSPIHTQIPDCWIVVLFSLSYLYLYCFVSPELFARTYLSFVSPQKSKTFLLFCFA